MKIKVAIAIIFVFPLFVSFTNNEVKDYLGNPGPLEFDSQDYNLNWSSHPFSSFFAQEYLSKGEDTLHFTKMILINAIVSDTITAKSVAIAKIIELEKRKKSDAVVNYRLVNNPDSTEYILDFVVSQGDEAHLNVVEWNAYRYKTFLDKNNHKGIMLFGISERGYGDRIKDFFLNLKTERVRLRNKLIQYKMPEVTITD